MAGLKENQEPLNVNVSKQIHRKLKNLANVLGRTKSELVREGIFAIFEKYGEYLIEDEDELTEEFKEEEE